jgi:RecB family exonuclease
MLLMLGIALIVGLYCFLRTCRTAKLSTYLTDHYMRIDKPIPICGIPDVIWIDTDGVLIVGDYKSRTSCQVQESDIIQLSVYRVLLERTQRRPVSNKGYVHFKDGRRVCVKLLDEKAIIALYNKYQKIISGKGEARCTNKSGYCQHCSYLDIC